MPQNPSRTAARPIIGITVDVADGKFTLGRSYSRMVASAGGVPLLLPCEIECVGEYLQLCNGVILSGGDDPDTTRWGVPVHPKANPMHADRQKFEVALLEALDADCAKPALGICLGMQLMGLHGGGQLDQHLPDSLALAPDHWDRREHAIAGELGHGTVHSHHRQALRDAGKLRVVARAPDGVIEAVQRDDRPFYLGVQWHPERTDDPNLGLGIVKKLINACTARP